MTEPSIMQQVPGAGVRGQGIWEHFTVLEGLPDMKVECLAEDRDGGIWIGTHDGGAARFDGERFSCYSSEDGLSSDSVYSITEDQQGNLWFATNRGLTRYDGSKFEIVEESLGYSFLWGSCMDESGALWFGLDRRPGKPAGVVRCVGGELELIEATGSEGPRGNSVKSITCFEGTGIYFCADDLHRVSGGEVCALDWPLPVDAHHHFNRIEFDSSGTLIVLTSTGTFAWKDSKVEQIAKAEMPGYSALSLHDGTHYLGTHSGFIEKVQVGEKSVEYQAGKSVQALLVDSTGTLWIGTYGAGLVRTEPGIWLLFVDERPGCAPTCVSRHIGGEGVWVGSNHGVGKATAEGWCDVHSDSKYTVTAVSSNGEDLWLGERNGTISLVDSDSRVRRFASPEARGFRVASIAHDGGTNTWYACSPGLGLRVICLNGTNYNDEVVDDAPQWVGALCYSEELGLLIGGNDPKAAQVFALKHDELRIIADVDHPVTAIAQLDGVIYIGTTRGLRVIGKPGFKFDDKGLDTYCVNCLCVDLQDRIWVGTEGAGVYLCRGAESSRIQIAKGLRWQIVDAIDVDESGGVWIATPAGLALYRERSPMRHSPALQIDSEGSNAMAISIEADQEYVLRLSVKGHGWPSVGSAIRWRIVDADAAWKTSTSRSISLPRLPEGRFTLEAYGRDRSLNRTGKLSAKIQVRARRSDLMVEEALRSQPSEELIGRSGASLELKKELAQAASSKLPVLLQGETGTGKTMAARILHELSPRAHGPFVSVNCAAIADSLAESELFGHVKGSFTGAVRDRVGKFELANGGTLLLDEVGDLSPRIQAKLLHVLHDGFVEPVGSSLPVHVDVRVLGATNRDMRAAISNHTFREDLYYRLNAFEILVPPLRDRREDIELLANAFLLEAASKLSARDPQLYQNALRCLLEYDWPGNVRELQHVIERGVILSGGGGVANHHLALRGGPNFLTGEDSITSWDQHERDYLETVIKKTGGRIAGKHGAASLLGLPPSTLRSRLKRLGLI